MPRTGENIYKRKDGRWEGRYIKNRIGSKTSYGYIYGKSYKEVKLRLIKSKAEWEQSKSKQNTMTDDAVFFQIASAWLNSTESFLKESTIIKYKNMLRLYILPAVGDCKLSQITNEKILLFCNDLLNTGGAKKSGLSPKTVTDILSLLRSIQKYALNQNMQITPIPYSCPIRQVQKPLRVFSIPEQMLLCDYLKSDPTLCNLGILLCLFTGIRLGELCALTWGDISVSEQTLHIRRTMQRLHIEGSDTAKTKILLTSPKSPCSNRFIPIPGHFMEYLIPMEKQPDSFFLTGEPAKFIEPRRMQYHFKHVLAACGIPDANFHILRHTFATRCTESGFDLKSLSEILGHANVNITLNRYVHPTLEAKRENMTKMYEQFSVR